MGAAAVNADEQRWLVWGAIAHRPTGAPRWDEPGTAKAIADVCGTWTLAVATEHVLAHARDPKAKTPFAIKGPMPHTQPQREHRHPAVAGSPDECRHHPGEHADHCRSCAGDRLAGEPATSARRGEGVPPPEGWQQARAAMRGGV